MSKPTVSGVKHQELPQPDRVALRRLAHLFDGLADDARDAMSADGISTGMPFWRDASKLLCQASDAGARFDFWQEGHSPREIESSFRRLDEAEAVRGKIPFLTLRPTHFLGLIWLGAVKRLVESFPECFPPGSLHSITNLPTNLGGPSELYWWQDHWKMQRRACHVMASLLRDYPCGQVGKPEKASFVVGSKRVMTDGQQRLWNALDGRALTGKELASDSKLDTSEDTVRRWVSELRKAGYGIDHRRGRGYFRPDARPADSELPTAM